MSDGERSNALHSSTKKDRSILTSSPLRRESCLPRRDWGLEEEEEGGAAGEEEEACAAEASLSFAGRGAIDFFFGPSTVFFFGLSTLRRSAFSLF